MKISFNNRTWSASSTPASAGLQHKEATMMNQCKTDRFIGVSQNEHQGNKPFTISKMLHFVAIVMCLWFSTSAFAQDGCPTTAITGNTSFCAGASTLLNSNANVTSNFYNGIAISSYQWRRNGFNIVGATNATYTATTAGSYTVAVASSIGCGVISAPIAITVISPTATITGNTSFCAGASTTLIVTANAGGGNITSIQWKLNGNNITGATSASYIATAAGSYTVVVTNSNGCSVTSQSVPVTFKQIRTTETISACVSYNWHGQIYTASNNTATWTGTNAAGCDSIVTLNLTIKSSPTATITGNTSFCAGANTQLNANATSGGGGSVIATTSGGFHSLFLKNDGTVWATGRNNYGQLGNGTIDSTSTPVQVSVLNGITAIAAGGNNSLFLKNDGTVWATGENSNGQLGDGTTLLKTTPFQVQGLSDITAIAVSGRHSLFLKNDGTVWATGDNDYGQLGDGTEQLRTTPVRVSGLTDITAIATGGAHSLFLKNDGTVWATGLGFLGQLGIGYVYSISTPAKVTALSSITAIAGGILHSLFLKSDGTVMATGWNDYGQLGDGTLGSESTLVSVLGLNGITAIAAGGIHSLFLKNDGALSATGSNRYGELGNADTTRIRTPVTVLGLSGISAIAGGFGQSLFLKNDGTVLATGSNFVGQLGDGTTVNKSTPVPVSGFDVTITSYQWKLNGSDIAGATNATYTATEAGSYTVVVTNSNGCSVTSESVAVTVNQPTSFTETISACVSYDWHGENYTASTNTATWIGTNAAGCDSTVTLNLTITNSPTATITGNNSFCAGANTLLNANATSGGEAIAIVADFLHSLFLKNDGTVWATGYNYYGLLGDGTTEQRTTPVQVLGLSGITAIAGGGFHSLFLKNDGTVWATGRNFAGQLGDGTTEQRTTPVQVLGLSGITAIAAGSSFSLFLKNDSTVWAAGLNNIGQYGGGTTEVRITPSPVSGLSGITAIASGDYHSLFLKKDGTVLATGFNQLGALGDGTNEQKNTPVPVLGLNGITAIEASYGHSLFLKNDSTVWATGQNTYGQFGDGTTESTNTPVQVSGLSGITAITAGSLHSLFLKNDGTVLATGYNVNGALGDGTTEQRNTPVPLLALSGITAKTDASSHTLFLKNDGTVWATGYNPNGQLGDGTTVRRTTPVQVSGFDVTISSYQWKLNGSDIAGATNATYTATAAGSYTVVVTNTNGCSVTSEGITVTVKQPTSFTETISACVSYDWHGENYTASTNTATWTGTNAAGCDSTVTLNLTINQPTSFTETISACGSYDWHGVTYTASTNTATWTGTNAAGCDSIVTLNLTINQPTSFTEIISACVSYEWHGTTYTASNNTATWVGTNAAGCDSTVTLNLTIQNPSTAATSITSSVVFALAGTNFTLSVNGGSLGTDATWNWYTGSCGGTLIGTGASISVSQNVNTTYFVRAEGTCNTTDCASITVNSFCGATGITSSAGTTAICAGSPVTLTVVGSLSPGAQWRWDDECENDDDDDDDDDDDSYSNTSTFTVSPNSTKTYYVRSVGGTCGLTACVPFTVTVIPRPAAPTSINGNTLVCTSSTQTYSIAAIPSATSYTWALPPGISLAAGSLLTGPTTSITVLVSSSFNSGTIRVRSSNCSGFSNEKTMSVSKRAVPSTPGTIGGASPICAGSTQTYSISAVTNASNYTWTLPAGMSFAAGTTTNGTSVQVVLSNTFVSGTISVKANNICGVSSSARTKSITGKALPTQPSAISGATTLCNGSKLNVYSVTAASGFTFNWTVPTGATITTGQGTRSIKVTWGTTSGTVSVTKSNSCGVSAPSTKAVTSVGCRTSEEELAEETSIETAVNTDLSVYPNPTIGNATVVFGSEVGGKYTINVLNALGQVVYSKTASSMIGENTHAIDISELSSGLYFINLLEESGIRSLRLVKK